MSNEELIARFISYDSQTGDLTMLPRPREAFKSDSEFKRWNTKFANKKVTNTHRSGYIRVIVNRQQYFAHRVAWFLYYGSWPESILDHVNRIRSDNRIVNLRLADYELNALNRTRAGKSKSKSKYRGVVLHRTGKWQAQITVKNRNKYLGLYATELEAKKAFDIAELKERDSA